jgi:predicted molibdopterin-dependent oxidoreductase YjgC
MSVRSRADLQRGAKVTIRVDGALLPAFEGESVAVALLAAGRRGLRRSVRISEPRGLFCHMGACQECVVMIDGVRRPACQTPVREGLVVETRCSHG